MAKVIKRKCCVCGKEYEAYCPSCRESVNQPAYLVSFCSENCSQVYNACAGKFSGTYTNEEARALLDKCDLSRRVDFTPSTQNLIKEIYSATSPTPSVNKQNTTERKNVVENKDVKVKPSFNKNKRNKRK